MPVSMPNTYIGILPHSSKISRISYRQRSHCTISMRLAGQLMQNNSSGKLNWLQLPKFPNDDIPQIYRFNLIWLFPFFMGLISTLEIYSSSFCSVTNSTIPLTNDLLIYLSTIRNSKSLNLICLGIECWICVSINPIYFKYSKIFSSLLIDRN